MTTQSPTLGTVRDASRRTLFRDGFAKGLLASGVDAPWLLKPAGALDQGDGVPRAVPGGGVVVDPVAVHPTTGEPCFGFGEMPGAGDDHMLWRAIPRRFADTGLPGYDVAPDEALSVEAELATEAFGMARHPYGDAVSDPLGDLRLGAGALIAADVETRLVFNLSLTDHRVFALYERFSEPGKKNGFCRAVPVADRVPGQFHRLGITYDRRAGTARWSVDGREVLVVDRLGGHGPRDRGRLIDEGAPESELSPRQLLCGMCVFTLPGAEGTDGGPALVSDSRPGPLGPWGQGVRLAARSFEVTAY
ncbi:DUF6081 family protein [Streptomyces sp. NPDC001809]